MFADHPFFLYGGSKYVCIAIQDFQGWLLQAPSYITAGGFRNKACHLTNLIQVGKLGLTVLMFSIVFVMVKPLSAPALFAGFIAAQLVTLMGFLVRDELETEGTTSNGNG